MEYCKYIFTNDLQIIRKHVKFAREKFDSNLHIPDNHDKNKPQKLEDMLREMGKTGETGDTEDTGGKWDAGLTGSPVSGGGHFMKSLL